MSDPQPQRSPEDIRADIEQTREELADTAAALAYKADVKARADERKEEIKADVRAKVEDVKATVTGRVDELKAKAASSGGGEGSSAAAAEQARAAAAQVQERARQNPVQAAAVGAALLGFALGYLIARRRA